MKKNPPMAGSLAPDVHPLHGWMLSFSPTEEPWENNEEIILSEEGINQRSSLTGV